MRILPAGADARDVLFCQWLQVAHRGWARNARRNTIPAPAISPRALSRFPVSDAVVAGLTDSDRTRTALGRSSSPNWSAPGSRPPRWQSVPKPPPASIAGALTVPDRLLP